MRAEEEDDIELFLDEESSSPLPGQNLHPFSSENVTLLNRYIFEPNVLQGRGRPADHWVVHFCVDWYEPCMSMSVLFDDLASHWEEQLNADSVMSNTVRFAYVDCAVDKVLCNTQEVDGYPTIVHYKQGHASGYWMGTVEEMQSVPEQKKLPKWLERRLTADPQVAGAPQAASFAKLLAKHGVTIDTVAGIAVISMIVGAAGFMIMYDPLASLSTTSHPGGLHEAAGEKEIEHFVPEPASEPVTTTSHRFLPAEWADTEATIEL